MNIILIIILIIIIVIIFLYQEYEYFNYTNKNNSFYNKIPNIFFTKQFTDNLYIPPKPKTSSLESIDINSYIMPDIISNKIVCLNITDQGKCWENNNCQWIEKVGEKSFCDIAPKFIL
jgi:hypothetical protein